MHTASAPEQKIKLTEASEPKQLNRSGTRKQADSKPKISVPELNIDNEDSIQLRKDNETNNKGKESSPTENENLSPDNTTPDRKSLFFNPFATRSFRANKVCIIQVKARSDNMKDTVTIK